MNYELLGERISCPYCGETIEIDVDPSLTEQQYIEDCQVCCRPIELQVSVAADGSAQVLASCSD
ncbi:MAG: CPXCG motif-containing cysteine-rich protein [Pseudomonadota bacterium]